MSTDLNSPKYLSKQLKLAGLQKLKFYCQICEKQCRDANGFKSHIRSQPHISKIQSLSFKDIENYSKQFQSQFLNQLRVSHKNYINANRFYNELISDKEHIHMNSTKWSSLSQFIRDMHSQGHINIRRGDLEDDDESMNNLDIIYNGNADQVKAKDENADAADLTNRLILRQVKKDKETGKLQHPAEEDEDEQRGEIKPVKFQLSKPLSNCTALKSKHIAFKISKPNSIKSNPLKSNVFKKQ